MSIISRSLVCRLLPRGVPYVQNRACSKSYGVKNPLLQDPKPQWPILSREVAFEAPCTAKVRRFTTSEPTFSLLKEAQKDFFASDLFLRLNAKYPTLVTAINDPALPVDAEHILLSFGIPKEFVEPWNKEAASDLAKYILRKDVPGYEHSGIWRRRWLIEELELYGLCYHGTSLGVFQIAPGGRSLFGQGP